MICKPIYTRSFLMFLDLPFVVVEKITGAIAIYETKPETFESGGIKVLSAIKEV